MANDPATSTLVLQFMQIVATGIAVYVAVTARRISSIATQTAARLYIRGAHQDVALKELTERPYVPGSREEIPEVMTPITLLRQAKAIARKRIESDFTKWEDQSKVNNIGK